MESLDSAFLLPNPVNPYVYAGPVPPGGAFFGRTELLEAITGELRVEESRLFLLQGPRRIGKTSILLRLAARLPEPFLPVYFDLRGRSGQPLPLLVRDLASEIVTAAGGMPTPRRRLEDVGQAHRLLLQALGEAVLGRRLVLLFDQFDVPGEPLSEDAAGLRLFPYLQELSRLPAAPAFLITGGRRLELSAETAALPLFQSASIHRLSVLTAAEGRELLTGPSRGHCVYEVSGLKAALEATGRHPWLLQLLASQLYELPRRRALDPLGPPEVGACVSLVLAEIQPQLEELWSGLSRHEQVLLSAIAQFSPPERPVRLEELITVLEAHAARMPDTELVDSLTALAELELIQRESSGRLSCSAEMIRRWTVEHHRFISVPHAAQKGGSKRRQERAAQARAAQARAAQARNSEGMPIGLALGGGRAAGPDAVEDLWSAAESKLGSSDSVGAGSSMSLAPRRSTPITPMGAPPMREVVEMAALVSSGEPASPLVAPEALLLESPRAGADFPPPVPQAAHATELEHAASEDQRATELERPGAEDHAVAELELPNPEEHHAPARLELLSPQAPSAHAELAHLRLQGQDAYVQGNLELAREAYRRALLLEPGHPELTLELARTLLEAHEFAEAVQVLLSGQGQIPEQYLEVAGEVYLRWLDEVEYDEALWSLVMEEARRVLPDHPELRRRQRGAGALRVKRLLTDGRPVEAAAALGALGPNLPDALPEVLAPLLEALETLTRRGLPDADPLFNLLRKLLPEPRAAWQRYLEPLLDEAERAERYNPDRAEELLRRAESVLLTAGVDGNIAPEQLQERLKAGLRRLETIRLQNDEAQLNQMLEAGDLDGAEAWLEDLLMRRRSAQLEEKLRSVRGRRQLAARYNAALASRDQREYAEAQRLLALVVGEAPGFVGPDGRSALELLDEVTALKVGIIDRPAPAAPSPKRRWTPGAGTLAVTALATGLAVTLYFRVGTPSPGKTLDSPLRTRHAESAPPAGTTAAGVLILDGRPPQIAGAEAPNEVAPAAGAALSAGNPQTAGAPDPAPANVIPNAGAPGAGGEPASGVPNEPARDGAPASASARPPAADSVAGASLAGASVAGLAGLPSASAPSLAVARPVGAAAPPLAKPTPVASRTAPSSLKAPIAGPAKGGQPPIARAMPTTPGSGATPPAPAPPAEPSNGPIDPYQAGLEAVRAGHSEEALADFRRALEQNPTRAEVYADLGDLYQRQGRSMDALRSYQRAISLNDRLARAHYALGRLHQTQGHHDEAVSAFKAVIRLDPMSPMGHDAQVRLNQLEHAATPPANLWGDAAPQTAPAPVQLFTGQ